MSSTIFDAVLNANLEVIERHAHATQVDFIPAGRDATVVWGSYDFRFRNNTNFPVRIHVTTGNNEVNAVLIGTLR